MVIGLLEASRVCAVTGCSGAYSEKRHDVGIIVVFCAMLTDFGV